MVEEPAYRKSLGLVELVSLGVGGTIGSGIFVVPGIAAGIAGPSSLFAWVIVAASAVCVALSLAWIQSRSPAGTTFTAIFEPVFGARVSAALVSIYLVSSVFGVATIAAGLGQYIGFFSVPHVLAAEIFVIMAFLGVNLVGIALSGWTENVLTAAKIVPIVLIAVALLPFIRPENLVPARAASLPDILKVVIIVYWPFTGFEISAIPVDETRDPRTISRALLLVMLLVCTIYLVLNLALIGSVGSAELAASPAPVATAAGLVFAGAGPLVALIGIITMFSALNAYIVGTSRVMQNMAARYRLSRLAGLTRRGIPKNTLVISCILSAGLLFFSNSFGLLASVAVVTTLVPYIAICLVALRLSEEPREHILGAAGAALTAAILVLYFVL
ncbi:MAG TPA: APC family permease [Methanomicrobiales archaeon]|nr:APC family permease [Methanomicrobiales archaeon]